ncbi:MAG: hypothetical protein CMP47_11030, partial [Rickettsiales bacterium]|nr:hypothetical protein [Rickettsiales bacterium]
MHAKEIRSSNSENVLPAKSCLVNSSRRHERGDEGIKILSQGQEQEQEQEEAGGWSIMGAMAIPGH